MVMGTGRGALIAGRYRVESELGKGGSGEVLRVLDVERNRIVALKRLPALAVPQLRTQFELEYRTLASLRHPRIVAAHEFGRDDDSAFYTMELLHGEDLAQRAPLPWREVCALLRDAAEGLGVLHARGLVHRDISARNLWRGPDGRVKLIDFGAVTAIGTPPNLVGTPPCVPPEALERLPLDARADLYALGAVGYYLLTGLNAFPARALAQLPELWRIEPAPPSHAVAELGRSDLPALPAELDALMAALLSRSAVGRPASTAQLIDRLDHLLGDTGAAASSELAEAQLAHPAFVGRERERRRLRRLFTLASHGRGQSVVVAGDAGQGRTRLLRELALELGVEWAWVVYLEAKPEPELFACAAELASSILEVQPQRARAALKPFASTLAQASGRLRERLGIHPPPPDHAGGLRLRAQMALRDWLLALAEQQPVVVVIDGLEHVDEASLATLLALALELRDRPILLVTSLLRDAGRARRPLEEALCRVSRTLDLAPLVAPSAEALLASVFGAEEWVPRLAQHLLARARGNPGHLLELCRQLVRRNVLRFASGAWLVPHELPEAQLATTHRGALRARLELLEQGERAVAQALSVHADEISPELEAHLLVGERLSALARVEALANLLDQGVLVRSRGGLRFGHEEQRQQLQAELCTARRGRLSHKLAEFLLAQPHASAEQRLRAGMLLLSAGDPRALTVLQWAGGEISKGRLPMPPALLAELDRAVATLRTRGLSERELVWLLVPLAQSGWQGDQRLSLRYGPAAVRALCELLGLARADRLRHYVGAWGALTLSLARARHELSRAGSPLDYSTAFGLLVGCATGMAVTAAELFDADSVVLYAQAIAPLAGLGPDHLGGIAYEYCRALVSTARDDVLTARASWERLVQRLDDAQPIRHLPAATRGRYLGGALYALGLLLARDDDVQALRCAERLASQGQGLRAEQIRTLYHGFHGDHAEYGRARARTEALALEAGATFRNEVWEALASSELCALGRDAMGLKRAHDRLARLSEELPSLRLHRDRCRAGYLTLHARFREALSLLEPRRLEEPLTHAGWLQSNVLLARIHNRLGEFAEAREVCEPALRQLRGLDLACGQHAALLAEQAVALAGLGEREAAHTLLAELDLASQRKGPLRRASLSETSTQLALLAGEPAAVERELLEFERGAERTGIPTLVQHARAFSARVHAPNARLAMLTSAAHGERTESTWSRVERTLGGALTLEQRAERALAMLIERAGVLRGQLYLLGDGGLHCCGSFGELPGAELEAWLRARLAEELEDDATELVLDEEVARDFPDVTRAGDELVRMLPLSAPSTEGHGVVGAVLLFAHDRVPGVPPDLLSAVSVHLSRSRARQLA
jgi:Protein kinase domain/AAA ATPase domain